MKKITVVLSFLLIVASLFSQSILWKVTGKKIKSPCYLYGTIHIQDKKVFAFDQTVTTAFDECDAFAMEILMDDIDPNEIKTAMFMEKKTIKEFLTDEQYNILDSIVKEKTGTGMFMYNKMKPFFLSSQLMQMGLKQDMEMPLDLYFLDKARKAGKSCYGVEKFMNQINAIDAISIQDQVDMLYEGLTDTSSVNSDVQFEELVQAYLNFDMIKLFDVSNDTALPKEFNKAFLVDRNIGMAKNFIKIAKKESLFCAVGAAHLPGEKGVIELLRKKGYAVEPIPFTWKIEVEEIQEK
ncbi:MAG: TraB/GumN family protein [Bacteroidales bacterium]|nr:TraB/GumN family protein [Bacteroidales bacterium]MDY0141923.1 TraB/GumN family protein [Bacteroidales bacterium]